MEIVGIICEYNPFHNGHIYHIKKIKKLYPESLIILVMSGNFLQRGEASLINKWDKTKIALKFGVNLVVELPFHFATQAADIFAKGAIKILNELGVTKIVFGTECNDISYLTEVAKLQLYNPDYQLKVKEFLDTGVNYPTALSRAIRFFNLKNVTKPNDILGLAYIKEILLQNPNIEPVSIKRTTDYHSKILNHKMASATSIRIALDNYIDITPYVPKITLKYLNSEMRLEKFFPLLRYKIISEIDSLDRYQTVDEGIENKIKKEIYKCINVQDLVERLKCRRYTQNRIQRMLIHILCGFTKEEALKYSNIYYIRILGFDIPGREYLNKIKKDLKLKLISNYSSSKGMLDLEYRVNAIYASVLDDSKKFELTSLELKSTPIIKKIIVDNIKDI